MPPIATSIRLSEPVAELLNQLATLRGMTKVEIVMIGILAQAEAFGLIPSLRDALAEVMGEPTGRRQQLRLSQQRSRARKEGADVPVRKAGRPRKTPTT
jgi:hypothetical protein